MIGLKMDVPTLSRGAADRSEDVRDPDRGRVRSHAVRLANAIRNGTPTMMIQMVLQNANQKNE